MKTSGFRAPARGGKKLFAVSVIVAWIVASLSVVSVLAAPPSPTNPTGNGLANVWGSQWHDLQFAQAWYNNYRSQPGQNGNSQDRKIQQYLDRYAFALRQAGAIIRGSASGQANNSSSSGSNPSGQNNASNGQFNNQGGNNQSAQQQLAFYLHMMRGLRDKILTGDTNNSNNTIGQ